MSWRLLLFTLLIMAAISTLGGIYAGDWLIEHAPKQANVNVMNENDPALAANSDGSPLLFQPAQPLINGKLGVPDGIITPILWRISPNNLASVKSESIGTADFASVIPTISDTITVSSTSHVVSTRPIGSAPVRGTQGAGGGWVGTFNQKMSACRKLGFGKRGECVRETRATFCGNNDAWGQVPDCPSY